jgi:hypothetical protein
VILVLYMEGGKLRLKLGCGGLYAKLLHVVAV